MDTTIQTPFDQTRPDLLVNGEEATLTRFDSALGVLRKDVPIHRKDRATNSDTCPATLVYPKGEIVFVDKKKHITFAR